MKIIENDKNGIFIEEDSFEISFYKGEIYINNICFSEKVTKEIFNKMQEYFNGI